MNLLGVLLEWSALAIVSATSLPPARVQQERTLRSTCQDTFSSHDELFTAVNNYIDNPGSFASPMNDWCVGEVTRMNGLFAQKTTFNEDLSNWDVSAVGNMRQMFQGVQAFNQDLSKWNVTKVADTSYMFDNATAFNQDLSDWDVSKVWNAEYMFNHAEVFNQDLSDWDVSNARNIRYMFRGAEGFNQNLNSWDVSKVTNMDWLFGRAKAFNQDLSDWNVSKVTKMFHMFSDAEAFNQDLSDWDVSKVTMMSSMFSQAQVFNQDLSEWNVSKVAFVASMFRNAKAFNQDLSGWNVSKVKRLDSMFSFTEAFNQDLSDWDVSKVESMNSMFFNAEAFNQDLSNWDISKVTLMAQMFRNTNLNQDFCAWGRYYNESSVNYRSMFQNSDCVNKGSPTTEDGPWCSSSGMLSMCPTGAPTSSPTSPGPTAAPTTSGPTSVLTTPGETRSGPWTIDFLGIRSDFTFSSEDELALTYEIGKDREYETFLYEKDCVTNITDIAVNSTKLKAIKNETHELLTLGYSFDKSAIANSTIWNSTSDKIEICQVVNLIVPEGDGLQKMVIVDDIRVVNIGFDLSVNYTVGNELEAGTLEAAASEANVSSYVQACKCKGVDSFTCDPAALAPNAQLYLCIKSVSSEVRVKQLINMVVTQGTAFMDVIVESLVKISSIADMTYVEAQNGVVVSTFVPTNIFNYSAGASINITGEIDMELVGSRRRSLTVTSNGDTLNADGSGQESYELKVDLQDGNIFLEKGAWMDSSGAALLNRALALLGMVVLYAVGVW